MPKMYVLKLVLLSFLVKEVISQGLDDGSTQKLRVCMVEGRGTYRRAGKFCPLLEEPKENSGIECVIGNDRLDCLRRMSKGTVDFGVFSPEDLIAAQWAGLDVLVTNELKHRPDEFESNIVAIVNKKIVPETESSVEAILRHTSLCHPGVGADESRGLSDTLSQYLESLVTPKSCDARLSLAENRIKSMARFFRKACKAGPWVPDAKTDMELKSKYPSLCSACVRRRCGENDPYWGMAGALNCLTYGSGDVTWVTFKDALNYFKDISNANNFALLCRDGTTRPINGSDPCVWLKRPWPAIVSKRKSAEAVSKIAASLTNNSVVVDKHWRGALAKILETNRALAEPLTPPRVPLDHLSKAKGFIEAYSQSGCTPPRHVTICVTSIVELNKCNWLSEAASVYGVDPPLQCSMRKTIDECFAGIRSGEFNVTIANSDWLVKAKRDYEVEPILYETTPIIEKLNTVAAFVKNGSKIRQLSDLRGKKMSMPNFDGFVWHSIVQHLHKNNEITDCDMRTIANYFDVSCVPGLSVNVSNYLQKLTKNCFQDGVSAIESELEALRSLIEDRSDVAFISMATYNRYRGKHIPESWAKEPLDIVPVCPENNKDYCLLSWSTLGQVYAVKNLSQMKKEEIIFMFKKIDQLFGKDQPFHTAMFSMYGSFNHRPNVLFHNNTSNLATVAFLNMHPYNKSPLNISNFESESNYFKICPTRDINSHANTVSSFVYGILLSLVFSLFYNNN